jgi:hypothetical protein
MTRTWAISLVILAFLTGGATDAIPGEGTRLSEMDRAVSLAVELEVRADRLDDRRDVCLAFGHGLAVDEKGIFFALRRRGLRLQAEGWCNQGPRGSVVSVVAPVRESPQGTYEVVVQLGDLRAIKESGAHFGTLVRRGTYVVRSEGSAKSELIAYRKSCCPESTGAQR